MRVKRTAVAASTAALLTLAACGGGGDGGTSGTGGTDNTEAGNAGAGQDPDREAPAADVEGAESGGDILIQSNQVPFTLDPTRSYYTDSTAIMNMVTRALTQYVPDPETGDMVLVPDMATDLGRPNEDLTEWTFTLREGLKYQDGSDVKPEDVAYAIKRSFAIDELPDGPTYNTTFFLSGDTYKGPFQDKNEYDGVEVDGQDIIIKMRRPFGDMPYYASFPSFTGIPEAKDKNPASYGNMPMATGPYQFDSYKPGNKLVLTRNEYWDPETDPGRHQYADTWTFEWGVDSNKIDQALINDTGSAQTTATYDDIQAANYARVINDEELKQRLVTGTSPCTFMWYLDMRKITDIKVRQAIGHAYPYQETWRAAGYIEGVTRIPSTTILPPGTEGRVEYDVLGNEGVKTDTAKAKALLEEAGEVGYELKFFYETDDPTSVDAKNVVVQSMEEAGFKVTPLASTEATRRDDESDAQSPANIRSTGWCSDWPSGGSWFPAQWDGELVKVPGAPNPSYLNEPDVNKKIDDILDNLSGAEAAQAWGELDEYIQTEHYPAVTIGYSGVAFMHGSRIGGVSVDNVRGVPNFLDMYVIPE
jgi:peptide/nickel transport system substrate-binding protein